MVWFYSSNFTVEIRSSVLLNKKFTIIHDKWNKCLTNKYFNLFAKVDKFELVCSIKESIYHHKTKPECFKFKAMVKIIVPSVNIM